MGRVPEERTLVVLAGMPSIMREIVREVVADEPDLAILEGEGALTAIPTAGACVAITHLDEPRRASLARLLGTRAQVRVIALSSDGRYATVYDVRLRQRPLGSGEISPVELLAAIRLPSRLSADGRRLTLPGALPGMNPRWIL